ncbi:hypothetical protein [Thermoproteus tenax]|uniref:Uncharacterized protein n=1 Tax=Thermoproteus tenax (strain ATCC 35583 / DSM 2078 / JCM 9277 / NBRC 100435 / Kra 1) TaxID=768679 RepID=G4RP18_THETK|nr:hypothetical protein [Thermoproteus tenax]CCC81312.1 hypothetical protein TTX_0652 [Thermoproteus tenax Kra 1]
MELGIQLAYLRRFPPDKRMEVLRRRERRGLAFNMSMLERSGLPGPHKARILRTYLKVAAYVHPTTRAMSDNIDEELERRALESIHLIFKAVVKNK